MTADRPDFDGSQPCAQTDPELFFPEKGSLPTVARQLCATCPFYTDCREFALDHPELTGVWGGTTQQDRQRLRSARSGEGRAA